MTGEAAIDMASASPTTIGETVRAWVEGAWPAWETHRVAVREQAAGLVARLG